MITPMISQVYFNGHLSSNLEGLLKGSASWGALIGQLVFGYIADKYGRKKVYGIELLIIIIGTIGSALSGNSPSTSIITMLVLWRLFMGIGIGGDYPISNVITSEFAGKNHRGMMIAAVFAMQGVGIVLAALVSVIVLSVFKQGIESNPTLYHDYSWRICVGVGCIPGLVAVYFRLTFPESPRFSADVVGDYEKAQSDTLQVQGVQGVQVQGVQGHFVPVQNVQVDSFTEYFAKWKNLKVLLGCSIAWFALDGILLFDLVGFYGTNLNTNIILEKIGYGVPADKSVFGTLFNIAVGNLLVAVIGSLPGYLVTVATVEILGRKTIQYIGFIALIILFAVLAGAYNWLTTVYIPLFIILYGLLQFFNNFGPNATTFIIPGECFPTRFRATAHGISAASGKAGAILAAHAFSSLKDIGGKNAFVPNLLWIFCGFMVIGLVATAWVPETRGKSLEELSKEE
jgi:PHS family inorganic phosphate transporter-like MFS transporter